ncbi:MAG: M28 family peptidase [Bacteroidota bacterium]|nr:M28 family peptidase [Bacteroidota bacterium]
MKHLLSILLVLSIIIGCSSTQPIFTSKDVTAAELQRHVMYLASDELEGRRPGTKGNELAADYIAEQFKSYGLKPLGDNGTYFQNFKFVSELKVGKNNSLAFNIDGKILDFTPDVDFRPMNFSSDTSITAQLVFAGYGIEADTLHYNDYTGIDVSGKIAIILRYSPDGNNQSSNFSGYSSFTKKIMTARDKGAAGVIFITGPVDEANAPLLPLRHERGSMNSGIAVTQLDQNVANSLFQSIGIDLYSLQKNINENKKPNSFIFENTSVALQTEIEKIYSNTANVVGYFYGNDASLKNEHIIIGAHFDHLGLGGASSGSIVPDTIAVHNGADDNASGIAGLLEIAQSLTSHHTQMKRSYVFAAFSAEELGLLGSAYYVKNSPLPLDKSVAMINLDMIGRLKDSVLTIQGVGTSPVWNELIQKQSAFGGSDSIFKLKLGQDGFGSSDHASFNSKEIPVLFFFTGLHGDYHRPSDDWQLINYEGQKMVTDFVIGVVRQLDAVSEKPKYVKIEQTPGMREGGRGFRVSFGIMPDFGDDSKGMRISGTRAGSPAERAGLKANDIILMFGGKSVKNIYDLTSLLGDYKPGDEVEVVVLRGEETLTMKATLQGR